MKTKSKIICLSLLGLVLAAVVVLTGRRSGCSPEEAPPPAAGRAATGADSGTDPSDRPADAETRAGRGLPKDASSAESAETPESGEEQPSAEEAAAAAEEAKVETFDNLTDKWMEPAKDGVSMKDVDDFVATLRRVPKDRREECVQRALNLIPDENVMLLAGILMDKSADKGIVETVFNDILNRDEAVKLPILREVYKDKTHPCWADTAWIFDVTGEKAEGARTE